MEPTTLDFSEITDERLLARGKYATINFELRQKNASVQNIVQDICDLLRHALNETGERRQQAIFESKKNLENILELSKRIDVLNEWKDQLYDYAWGTPVEDTGEILGNPDPL
jgi:hypothetical protein